MIFLRKVFSLQLVPFCWNVLMYIVYVYRGPPPPDPGLERFLMRELRDLLVSLRPAQPARFGSVRSQYPVKSQVNGHHTVNITGLDTNGWYNMVIVELL